MTNSRINPSSINPMFIYFKMDPHLRTVAVMTDQQAAVILTTQSCTIWAISAQGIRWIKDDNKHANSTEWQAKYYEAVDDYVEGLNGLLNLFAPDDT